MKLLDIVALTEDLEDGSLRRGHVGTIVEILAEDVFEVEFVDNSGYVYALRALKKDQLMVLYYNNKTEDI